MKKILFEPYSALKSILEVTSNRIGNEFLLSVCFELKKLFKADAVFIAEAMDINPTTKVQIKFSTSNELSGSYYIKDTPCQLVFKNGITNINKGVNKDFQAERGTSYESFYGVPLHNEEYKLIGHIAILSNYPRELPNEAEDIALIFSQRIETEMTRLKLEEENKKITEKLYIYSITDPLTELYNRRHFVTKCQEIYTQVKRGAINDATVIFLDIDDFKLINDQFGHATGDYVLRNIGKLFLENSRENIDYIARVGGEEFGILSINTSLEISRKHAKRLTNHVKDFFKDKEYSISFSIGIAPFDTRDRSWEDTYNLADDRMYIAKNTGKDKIITFS